MRTSDYILEYLDECRKAKKYVRNKDISDFIHNKYKISKANIQLNLTRLKNHGLIDKTNTFENRNIFYYFLKEKGDETNE